jgi:hypothetical protein
MGIGLAKLICFGAGIDEEEARAPLAQLQAQHNSNKSYFLTSIKEAPVSF